MNHKHVNASIFWHGVAALTQGGPSRGWYADAFQIGTTLLPTVFDALVYSGA
jgi:hypothetical protein